MNKVCIYVDQNNLFFRYKRLDFKALLNFIGKHYEIIKSTSYMAYDLTNESQKKFITYLSNNGFKCITVDMTQTTNIDHILTVDMTLDLRNLKPDAVILISGDGHFAYCLDTCSKYGVITHVIGAKDYIAFDLLKIADKITYLENIPNVVLKEE